MSRRPHFTARRISQDQLILSGKTGLITVTRDGGISDSMEEAFCRLMEIQGFRAATRAIEGRARRMP